MPPRLRHPPTSAAVTTPKKGQNHTGQTQSSNDDEHANEGLRMADSDPVSSEHLFESYPHPNMYEPLWSKLSCSLQPASWMNESPVSSNLLGLESHLDTLYPVLINGLKSAANTCTLLLGFRVSVTIYPLPSILLHHFQPLFSHVPANHWIYVLFLIIPFR